MFMTAILAFLSAGGLGLLVKAVAPRFTSGGDYSRSVRVSWAEFAAVSLVMAIVIIPGTLAAGRKLGVDNIVRYQQFVNGVETKVHDDVTTCYAGHSGSSASAGYSNCAYTYVSGSYSWIETYYENECTTGADGKQNCQMVMKTRVESANIYSPYLTREHTYSIDSSMGKGGENSYRFNNVYADANPQPYDRSVKIPSNIPRGAPADWQDARNHLNAGDPRAVTMLASYDNYILASKDEGLKTYGGDIDRYSKAHLLPEPAKNMMKDPLSGASHSQADKVSFVGVSVANASTWQQSLMRFNAALGMQLQGDLHVVVVNSDRVPGNEAETYTNALKAYWQSAAFGKRAIAKNAVILVIGTSGDKITWARGTTGMPFGNETMEQWFQDWLPGLALDPQTLFGSPTTVIKPGIAPDKFTGDDFKVTLTTPRGMVEKIMFEEAPFKRARMSCDDGTCVGYKDLLDKIQPTGTQKTVMIVIIAFIALGAWILVAMTSFIDDAISALPRQSSRRSSDDDVLSYPTTYPTHRNYRERNW